MTRRVVFRWTGLGKVLLLVNLEMFEEPNAKWSLVLFVVSLVPGHSDNRCCCHGFPKAIMSLFPPLNKCICSAHDKMSNVVCLSKTPGWLSSSVALYTVIHSNGCQHRHQCKGRWRGAGSFR